MVKNKAIDNGSRKTIITKESHLSSDKGTFTLEDKICLGLLLVLILLVFIIRSKFLLIPFERDEGIYGYYGKLLLEGKIPYKDFYEQKFPGLFYFYGFMVSVFGDTVKGLHTGFMYLNIASIIIVFYTSRLLFSPIAGLLSAITFAFVSLTPTLSGFTVQAEHGVAFFSSLTLICLGIIGEYIVRIYDEVRNRPYTVIEKTINIGA